MKKLIVIFTFLLLLGCRGTTKSTGDYEINKEEEFDSYYLYIQYDYRLDLTEKMIEHIISTNDRKPTRDTIFINPSPLYIRFRVYDGAVQTKEK